MADDDEIDILGDFSFNSCLAQNSQGIPSCADREDTVHPQWLLDSMSTNWYDIQTKDYRGKDGPSRKLSGNSSRSKYNSVTHTSWSQRERDLLIKEMVKYGRNVRKISQTIKTKTEAEIQALIEAEYGVHLETPSFGLEKHEDHDNVPSVVQEEIVTDDVTMNNVIKIVTTGAPTITMPKKPFRKKKYNLKSKNSILKPTIIPESKTDLVVSPSEIFYEDDLIVGSTESIGSDMDSTDIVSMNIVKQQSEQREKVKALKKMGNHRRKVSRNYDKGQPSNKSTDLLKSPPRRQRKDSSMLEDNVKSPKMQIVIGPGQTVPVSDGEQVIKIEKKKDSEPESDIEIDVDSDNEGFSKKRTIDKPKQEDEPPIAVPLTKFEPMPKRQKRINLDGGGGYTIMHTAAGDLVRRAAEPRRPRAPRRRPPPAAPRVPLLPCRRYSAARPAPYNVRMLVSALISMDAHAHTSRAEVMGMTGGEALDDTVTVVAYCRVAAAACGTHCDMDPVSQAAAAARLHARGLAVCAWHHSHPRFPPAPSARDLRTQRALQRAAPLLALITSQHWPAGRRASMYRCIRVEEDDEEGSDVPTGYQFSVKLVADLTLDNLAGYLDELRAILRDSDRTEYSIDMESDVCPDAGLTYLEKCICSISHHMRSAGYEDGDPVTEQLVHAVRNAFR